MTSLKIIETEQALCHLRCAIGELSRARKALSVNSIERVSINWNIDSIKLEISALNTRKFNLIETELRGV